MRKIQTQDVFKLARIIKRAEVKKEISAIIKEVSAEKRGDSEKEDVSEKVGIPVFLTIMENCSEPAVETQIYDLLGGIAEVPPEDVKAQSLEVTLEQIKQMAAENNMMNFFKTAGKLP